MYGPSTVGLTDGKARHMPHRLVKLRTGSAGNSGLGRKSNITTAGRKKEKEKRTRVFCATLKVILGELPLREYIIRTFLGTLPVTLRTDK